MLGINAADDIPPLAARHPEVEFVATTRDGRRSFGHSVPFITDILTILGGTGAPVIGILNSDLLFHPSDGWARIAATVQRGAIVAGRRHDLCTLNGGALYPYIPGFDYFFFSRAAGAELASTSQSFAMGIPWWDYWLPLSLACRGHALRSLASPLVLHLMHGERAGQPHTETWRMLAFELADQLAGIADRQHVPAGWENLVALCRKMVSHRHDPPHGPEIDHTIAALIPACVQLISAAPGDAGDDTGARDRDHDVPPEWFASISDRITAGRFMRDADAAARRGALSQAGTLYERAIACAPRDAGLLSMYGNFLQSRGDLKGAARWVGRAAHLAPDSGYILNGFGTLLLQLGRPREAAGWLEKAVAAEPVNGSA